MLRIEDLTGWLRARGVQAELAYNRTPAYPAEVVTLSATGGLAMTVETAYDQATVQVRARSDDPRAARDLAHLIDRALIDSERPFGLGASQENVIDVGRLGGPPAYLEQTDYGWTTYSCNYYLEIER